MIRISKINRLNFWEAGLKIGKMPSKPGLNSIYLFQKPANEEFNHRPPKTDVRALKTPQGVIQAISLASGKAQETTELILIASFNIELAQ